MHSPPCLVKGINLKVKRRPEAIAFLSPSKFFVFWIISKLFNCLYAIYIYIAIKCILGLESYGHLPPTFSREVAEPTERTTLLGLSFLFKTTFSFFCFQGFGTRIHGQACYTTTWWRKQTGASALQYFTWHFYSKNITEGNYFYTQKNN